MATKSISSSTIKTLLHHKQYKYAGIIDEDMKAERV